MCGSDLIYWSVLKESRKEDSWSSFQWETLESNAIHSLMVILTSDLLSELERKEKNDIHDPETQPAPPPLPPHEVHGRKRRRSNDGISSAISTFHAHD